MPCWHKNRRGWGGRLVKRLPFLTELSSEADCEYPLDKELRRVCMNKKSKVSRRERSEFLWGWMFLLPTMAGLIILNIIPIFQTIYQSFFKTGAFGKGNIFIGLDNYRKLFSDGTVWQALWNTCKYALVEVPFSIAIALVIAVFLNGKIRGRSIWRTIYFLPMVAAPAAVAMVWRWLYNSEFGLLNHILRGMGFSGVNWISNPNIAFISVAVVGIWSVIGYNMVLFFAGLQEIPRDYYEAAQIDGADGISQFFTITLPLISPTMFFVTVTRVIGAMQVFDSIYMMMGRNNPALGKTQSLVYLFYKYSFIEGNKGYGSSIVMLLLLVILLITVIQMFCQKKWVNYS
jgi:multiple sugar transport system permease protein